MKLKITRTRKLIHKGILPAALTMLMAPAGGNLFADPGETLFKQKCVACHSIGGGRLVGPDLKGVEKRRERDWILRFIREPDTMVKTDPIAKKLFNKFNKIPMTNFKLGANQAEALLAYISGSKTPAAGGETLTGGNATKGKLLFIGGASFKNGGAACITCHSVTTLGSLGGGSLGPDLTQVIRANRLGDKGLAGALKGLPFPTMRGIYEKRPLAKEERAHLFAFFKHANKGPTPTRKDEISVQWNFIGMGLVGFVILALLPFIFWRNRFKGVRKALVGGNK